MKNFIDRLFKSGLITTMLGICILGIGVFLYISKEHNEIEAGAVCTIGLLLLRSKDSLIGISKK